MAAISQMTLHHNNAALATYAPSTMLIIKNDLFLCKSQCAINAEFLFESSQNGLAAVFLKYENIHRYLALTVKKTKKKT